MFIEPKNRRRLFLFRHAETSYVNDNGQPVTDSRQAPLTTRGLQQANSQAELLKLESIDKVICSDLLRTQQTAKILTEKHQLDLNIIPELKEIDVGDMNFIDPEHLMDQVAHPFDHAGEPGSRFLGGELFSEFDQRVIPAFQKILDDDEWQSLVIVAHGVVNRLLLQWMLGVHWPSQCSFEQDPCCLNIIDIDGHGQKVERFIIRAVNITEYNLSKHRYRLTTMETMARQLVRGFSGKK